MSKQLLVPFAIGMVVIVAAVAGVLYMQRHAHIELQGKILKVRSQPMDAASSVAVVDFRFTNPSDYNFVIRKVDLVLQEPNGNTIEGTPISEVDAQTLFKYYPLLGDKYNVTLLMRDKVAPRQTLDRMVAARFEVPEEQVRNSKNLTVRIEEVDGAVSEFVEKQ